MWGITTSLGFRYRAVVVSICFAAVGMILVESFRWVEKKKLAASPHQLSETPLAITSKVTPYVYARGAGVGGVHFLPEFTDTRVFIENSSDIDYESSDLYISTDMNIQGYGQVSAFEGVIFILESSPEMAIVDKQGHTTGVFQALPGPLDKVRVRCATIPKHSSIELVIALATLNSMEGGKPPARLYAPRRPPKWIRVSGTYRFMGQDHAIDITVTPKVVAVKGAPAAQIPTPQSGPDTQRTLDNLVKTLTDALSKQPKGTITFWTSERQPNGSPNYVTIGSARFSFSYDPIARTCSFLNKATGQGLLMSFEPKDRHFIAFTWDEAGPLLLFVDGKNTGREGTQ